jgi:hypothetical protein
MQRRFLALSLAAQLLWWVIPDAAHAQQAATPPTSLMGRIRTFLGVQPRSVSVGGTRSSSPLSVCLLAPGPIVASRDFPIVYVLDPQPALVLGSQLNEIELRRGKSVLWSQLASSKTPIIGRVSWPLAPLQPGERLELAMRPKGAAGGDWAVLTLEGASAEAQQGHTRALQVSGDSAERRLHQIDQAATAGDAALAHALLWAPLSPNSMDITALQQEQQASCHEAPLTR